MSNKVFRRMNANEDMWQTITGNRSASGQITGARIRAIEFPERSPVGLQPKRADPELEKLYQGMAARELAKPEVVGPGRNGYVRPRPDKCRSGHDMTSARQNARGYWWCRECARICYARWMAKRKEKMEEELDRQALMRLESIMARAKMP